MSTLGTTITQVRWPLYPISSGTGHIRIRMSRTDPGFPGAAKYAPPNANVLLLSDNGPALLSDIELNQSTQLTTGYSALDAITLQFRDCTSYSGTLGDGTTPLTEDLNPSTFFTEWFNDTAGTNQKLYPYALWIDRYANDGVTLLETAYLFHIDPNYKPQSDQLISSPMTNSEALNDGTVRTVQAIEIGSLISSTPFQCVLNAMTADIIAGHNPCLRGAGYMGYVYSPSYLGNKSIGATGGSDGNGVFSGDGTGNQIIMEATLYERGASSPFLIFNSSAPESHGAAYSWPTDLGNTLNFDPNHPEWYGPDGTWWISLGNFLKYCNLSFGQLFDTDAVVTAGSNIITSSSAKFSAALNGLSIWLTSPDGIISGLTITYISTTQISTSHTFINPGSNLYWFILGTASQQLGFNVTGQMGSGSEIEQHGMQVFAQKPDGANRCYPVDTTRGKILPKDIYISVNAFLGAHPGDGSQWMNPIAFSPTDTLDKVIPSITNFLAGIYASQVDPITSQGNFIVKAIGNGGGTWNNAWQPIGAFSEVEPSTGATAVIVTNTNDQTAVISPLINARSTSQYVIGPRLRCWYTPLNQTLDIQFLNGYSNGFDFRGGLLYDATIPLQNQADACFKAFDADLSGNKTLNPDCWKGLCYAMFLDTSQNNIMYPSIAGGASVDWGPLENGGNNGGWPGCHNLGSNNAFYALGCQYGPGFTPNANEPIFQRFNSVDYQAVVFATFNIQTGTMLLQRDYFGTADTGGLLSTLNVGIQKAWEYDGAVRTFTCVELPRFVLGDVTLAVKWQQAGASGYPDINDKTFGLSTSGGGTSGGGTSGSGTGAQNGGGTVTNPTTQTWPYLPFTVTGAGTQPIPATATVNVCSDNTTTGVSVAFGTVGNVIKIVNLTGNTFSTGDFRVPDSTVWVCMFIKAGVQFDPLVKTGWDLTSHTP